MSFQKRLIYYTMGVAGLVFVLTMGVLYLSARHKALENAVTNEQVNLNQDAELLAVMLRDGKDIDSVKNIATAPWSDGSGRYFIVESATDSLASKVGEILLTAGAFDGDNGFVVGEILFEKELLMPMQSTFNYFVVFSLLMLLILFVTIRYAIKRLSQPQVERERRLDAEFEIAKRIQQGMLPQVSKTVLPGWVEVGSVISASKEIGGDFYNYLTVGEHLHFIIADVSGKGVPAALFMAQTARLYASAAADDLQPKEIAYKLNEAMCSNNPASMFITALICRLDMNTGVMQICNAGHLPPIQLVPGLPAYLMQGENNIPLGAFDGHVYEQYECCLTPGTHFIVYTDGVTEAENRQGRMLGISQFMQAVTLDSDKDADNLVADAERFVQSYAKGCEQTDDITILDIRYPGQGLRIAPCLPELDKLFGFGRQVGLDNRMMLVLEEAVVNVITHGNATYIDIQCTMDADGVTLTVTDDGIPFDPTAPELNAEAPGGKAPDSLEEIQIGGQGIRLMRSVADRIQYSREWNRNILTITRQNHGISV